MHRRGRQARRCWCVARMQLNWRRRGGNVLVLRAWRHGQAWGVDVAGLGGGETAGGSQNRGEVGVCWQPCARRVSLMWSVLV